VGVKLTFEPIDLRLAYPWAVSRSSAASVARVVLVRMLDADGLEGVGEAAPIARYGESPESVGEFLRRLDPARRCFS
jgi:L-alanine-DL-glutamate epimerase-like enolase superfamily enzyme